VSKYLVTGGAGFIGSHLVESLVSEGEEVVVLDDLSTGKRENLEKVKDKIVFVEGDIRDDDIVHSACDGVDYVFHFAAQASVPRSIDMPKRAMDVNTTGTLNVLLAARDKGVKRVVASSSSSVYGKIDVEKQVETLATMPASPYALSKLAGEHLCRIFSEIYGLETVTLRYFNVFGPRQEPNSQYSAVIHMTKTSRLSSLTMNCNLFILQGLGHKCRNYHTVLCRLPLTHSIK